jgi:outer membrane immunogenic protein
MKKLLLSVLLGGSLAASSAMAADYAPPRPPVVPAVVEPAFTWTGFYMGLSGGGRWSKVTWTTLSLTPAMLPPDLTTTPVDFNNATGTVGGYFGYDWQIAPQWVWGLQADFDWGNSSKRNGGVPGTFGTSVGVAPPAAAAFDSSWVTERWDASVRARLGFLVASPWLIYATAGVGMQAIEVGASCAGPAAPASWCTDIPRNEPVRYARTGFTFGAGTEVAFSHSLFARFEYRYTYYGFIDYTFFQNPLTVDDVQTSVKLSTHTLVAGIAYRFN